MYFYFKNYVLNASLNLKQDSGHVSLQNRQISMEICPTFWVLELDVGYWRVGSEVT